jgi:hypothetical protein
VTAGADGSALPREPGARRWVLEALGIAAAVAVIHVLGRFSASFLVGAFNDDGVYVVLGKAIAQGEGYRSIHLIGAPVHVRYPPGFPLLLAIPWALGGTLDVVRATVAVVNLVATAAAAGLVWWIGRRHLAIGPWVLAVCAASAFVLEGSIQYFNIPLTGVPRARLGRLALSYPVRSGGGRVCIRPGAITVGLVLAGTALFRTAGIALLPAVLLRSPYMGAGAP